VAFFLAGLRWLRLHAGSVPPRCALKPFVVIIAKRYTQPAKLLSATAIERMAVVSSVTVVPNARVSGVALTGLHGYKAVVAMRKTLEHDGSKRVLRKQEGGRAHKSDEPLFHTFPHASMERIVQR